MDFDIEQLEPIKGTEYSYYPPLRMYGVFTLEPTPIVADMVAGQFLINPVDYAHRFKKEPPYPRQLWNDWKKRERQLITEQAA